MHLVHLSLHDFRSYASAEVPLQPGVSTFIGRNGQGKTNLVEAVDYLSRLASHRVSTDAPLVRRGTDSAVVRASVVREERQAVIELEINPGRANRARVNRNQLPRVRDLLGWVRAVVFSPEDLALVKGDPGERRRFLDDLATLRSPRYAGTRGDYDRVLKQRNSLLKSAGIARRSGGPRDETSGGSTLATLAVWDERLAELGGEMMARRAALIDALIPAVAKSYEAVAGGVGGTATLLYQPSFAVVRDTLAAADPAVLGELLLAALAERRSEELDRGLTLVGPHRDELACSLDDFPVKGYASHGESWSFALALRLASFDILRSSGDDPVLILDDVFAELDADRRGQLAALVADAEQVLVTAAVADDVPPALRTRTFFVTDGTVAPGSADRDE